MSLKGKCTVVVFIKYMCNREKRFKTTYFAIQTFKVSLTYGLCVATRAAH